MIFSISWNKKGERIATTSDDRTIRIWKIPFFSIDQNEEKEVELTEERVLIGHQSRVWNSFWFSIDQSNENNIINDNNDNNNNNNNDNNDGGEEYLVSCSEDLTIRIWELISSRLIALFHGTYSYFIRIFSLLFPIKKYNEMRIIKL